MGVAQTTRSRQGGTLANLDVTPNPGLWPNLPADQANRLKKQVGSVVNEVPDEQASLNGSS